MERNWLIRTTQNQILGPVAKSKVVEFLQKGALGLNDEVTSGNGYWFSLKEKDLVDKYLFGDLPQSYNPISESKSVLSKRENPDKTTSLNTAPSNKTQVLKVGTLAPGIIPATTELEYPDITLISKSIEVKSPKLEDLEFPDVSLITAAVERPEEKTEIIKPDQTELTIEIPSPLIEKKIENEAVIYPENDDLAYPDIDLHKGPELSAPKTELKEIVSKEFTKNNKDSHHEIEERKLLHERKVKASSQTLPPREKDLPAKENSRSALPEHLKKRNDNYLMYILVILILIILSLFFYYYRTILNKPLPV